MPATTHADAEAAAIPNTASEPPVADPSIIRASGERTLPMLLGLAAPASGGG